METHAVFGFITNMRRYASLLKARPIVLWDGFSDKRREFYPDYKANRDDNAEMKQMKEGFAVKSPSSKKQSPRWVLIRLPQSTVKLTIWPEF
jgi:5'-3' exonuclease